MTKYLTDGFVIDLDAAADRASSQQKERRMPEFKLTVWESGASLSAMIECPSFVDNEDDLLEVADALLWAQQRISQIDPMEGESPTDENERGS